MSDDLSDIRDFYDQDPQREHDRLAVHRLEFDLTWRYLERYLPRQGSLLEIGAASGRYTLALARRGYRVTAVDLSAELIKALERHLQVAGLEPQVRTRVADARDLGVLGSQAFDAVLLMGPLYHLIEQADRQAALRQAFDRLQPGGPLFSAWISRYGVLSDLLADRPQWIEDQAEVRSVLADGQRPPHYPRGGFRGYLAHPDEIIPFHEALGLHTLALAAVEPLIGAGDESYNRLQGRQRELWLELLERVSQEPSIRGASRHLLYIGRKL